jgi:hypothetical protein
MHYAPAVASPGGNQASGAISKSSSDSRVRSPGTRSQGAPEKEKAMKRIIATAFFAVASLLTTGNMSAQDSAVQVTIPFNFAVGNTVLPSGTYIVSSETPQMILVRNKDHGKLASMALINQANARNASENKLVFNRYGNEYFLNQILCPSAAIVAELPTSKREKRARLREEASLEQPEQVLLALK